VTPAPPTPDAEDLACQEVVEIVSDYLDGALSADERRRLEAHLESCPGCIEYVEQMREVGGAMRGLARDSIAPERRDALLEAFRDRHAH
jgi:anti-sigma factor (TIGR02949 family)